MAMRTRCWLVPDALADRLDDLDGGVALWLHELQRLAEPTGLGWDSSVKIVSPVAGAADLDSGCFDFDDDTPLARTKKLSDLSNHMDSDESSSCSECSSDSLEGEEWCVPQDRTLPALLEVDEEEDEEVLQESQRRYGEGSTEVIPWDDPPHRCTLPRRSKSEGELAERSKPRFFHTIFKTTTLFDVFPFDLFDDFQPVRQPTFDDVETEVLNTSEEIRRFCNSPVKLEESPDVLDDDLVTLFFEADCFADRCLSECVQPVCAPGAHSIFDTGHSTTPPIPPVRRKKLNRPRAATSDELLLLSRATERTKLKRSRSLSGDIRRSGLPSTRVVTSDLLEWKRQLLRSALLSDDDEDDMIIADMNEKWFSSSDGKGHVYYFEENSNESSWTLPEVSQSPQQVQEHEQDTVQQDEVEAHVPEVSDEEDADVTHKTLASELAAQFAKRCRAFPESNLHTGDKFSVLRAAKSRSMIVIDSDIKDDSPKEISSPKNWPQLSEGAMNVLKEGTLNRTKITENGKKLRKNWSSSHVVLTELCLLLFRDAKTFAAMKAADKSPGTNAPRPELSMDLNGASIDRAEREKLLATSRKNVFLVSTVLGLQVLFQCECGSQTDEWFNAVRGAIKKLPCGLDSCLRKDSDRVTLGPCSPEQNKKFPRIGRSKSVKLKSKDGSIEDLTVSTAERQTKIRARLKKFFNRRPTMESLVKKGIWKDEPAFGCFLEQACGAESPRVPIFVQKCIAVIESKVDNMKTDGLYRASGNLSQVQKIRLQVDQNNLAVLEQEEDVHVLTGTLKLFFRELKEPLIPYASFSKAIKASMNHSKKERVAQFRDIIKSLPAPNHDTLKFLLKHLLRVTSYQEFNRMHIPNLAIVFGPTLMWPEQESLNMALDLMQQNLVIETLLLDFEVIFR